MERSDKRIPHRRHMIYYSEVHDQNNAAFSGHLIDLSTSGIMLVTKDEVEKGQRFNFEIRLPEEMDGRDHIRFQAKCAWCRRDVNPEYFAAGFEIEKIDATDEEMIVALMYEYGFRK